MYLCHTEARSCNHCCSGKTIRFTYSEYVFLALGTQQAMHMHYIVICGCPALQTFFGFIS